MDGGLGELGRDLDGRVLLGGRRAADQQRDADVQPLHLLGHVHHLRQRRRDQPGQTWNNWV